jgi:hypothetical protein
LVQNGFVWHSVRKQFTSSKKVPDVFALHNFGDLLCILHPILPLPRIYFKEDSQAIGDIRQVTVTLDADTFERLKPGAARKIRHIVEEAVRSEVNIR